MAKLSKRLQAFANKVDRQKLYAIDEALSLVKECASAKFDESIDVAVQLGIDAKKSDQVVRGSVVLPAGTGKSVRVAVFAQGAKAGQVQFRVDKGGIIHATIGRASFEPTALRSNLNALVEALQKAKPATSKGVYLRKVALSSTMGVGVRVDQASLAAQ